jgi:hypothetical protein
MDFTKLWTPSNFTNAIDFFTPDINYNMLKDISSYQELEAQSLELKVEEEVNLLRENFIQSVGTYQTNTAKRGFKVGEGSSAQNVEMSAQNLGKDIQKAKTSVDLKAEQLRRSSRKYNDSANSYNVLDSLYKFKKMTGKKENE